MSVRVEPRRAAPTWWRRNRLWLALLLPLLLAALAASSFRMVALYLPWEWSRPIVAHDSTGTLRQTYLELDGVRRDREVKVTVISLDARERIGDVRAVDGGTLWRVMLKLEAAPDEFLQGCEVELTDAVGTRYGYRAGLESADDDAWFLPPLQIGCVPPDAPGPTVDPLSAEVVPSPVERPGTWQQEVSIAMPQGVRPTGVRIGWHEPVFLVLDVP